jgi:predicted kinase
MAGESGSGKSTLARAIGRATGAIVLDKDYIKAPLLEEGLPDAEAGGLSYSVFFSLARSLLDQGHSLILDSAAFYPSIRERGARLASEFSADYRLIECVCDDDREHEQRLVLRRGLASQPVSLAQLTLERATKTGIVALDEPRLTLDTTRTLDICLREALEYIGYDAG